MSAGRCAAVVGTGSIGRRHIANLIATGLADPVAISTFSRRDSLEVLGQPVPVLHRLEDALIDPAVQYVFIASPSVYHLELALRAVAAGRHVYLEKPASTSSAGISGLIAAAREARVTVAVGTQFRFHPLLVRLRDALLREELGTVIAVEAHLGEHIADYHPGEDWRQGYAACAELGGGVLLTQIHQIDYLDWLFGPFESVFAAGGRRGDLGIDVEDCVTYLLRTRSALGVVGHLNYLERPKKVTLSVTGTRATFAWDYFANALTITPAILQGRPQTHSEPFDRDVMFRAALADFFAAVAERRPPRGDLVSAERGLRIIDTIKRSMTSGRAEALQ